MLIILAGGIYGCSRAQKILFRFKSNAVQLTEEQGLAVAEIAGDLGIGKDLFYRWRKEHRTRQGLAFPGNGREALTSQQQKIRELGKKLKDTDMERDILKKAMAIFSRTSK